MHDVSSSQAPFMKFVLNTAYMKFPNHEESSKLLIDIVYDVFLWETPAMKFLHPKYHMSTVSQLYDEALWGKTS